MEATTDDGMTRIFAELTRLEESATYSGQGQHEQAKFWRAVHTGLGVATAVVTGAGASLAFAAGRLSFWAGVLGVAGAISAAVMTTLNPQGRAERAHAAANDYWLIQTEARQARHLPPAPDRHQVTALTERLGQINHRADQIGKRAYSRAVRNIAEGGQTYGIDGDPTDVLE